MTAEQEALVIAHMQIVPPIAKRLVKKFGLPFWIDIDEMISCGYVGLCKAALKYDPTRGKFETYATFRIRGNIIDEFLRRQTSIMVPLEGDAQLEYAESEDLNNESTDPTPNVEFALIEQQEHQRKCRHLAFAFTQLGEVELRMVRRKHMDDWTLKQISEAEQRSNAWVHCRVRAGAQQLREALLATGAE